LESIPPGGLRSRLTEIAVDHMDLLPGPALGDGTIPESILTLCAFGVLQYLAGCRLSNVQIGIAVEMRTGDLQFRHSPASFRVPRIKPAMSRTNSVATAPGTGELAATG
jgi:hypothetical protein